MEKDADCPVGNVILTFKINKAMVKMGRGCRGDGLRGGATDQWRVPEETGEVTSVIKQQKGFKALSHISV